MYSALSLRLVAHRGIQRSIIIIIIIKMMYFEIYHGKLSLVYSDTSYLVC